MLKNAILKSLSILFFILVKLTIGNAQDSTFIYDASLTLAGASGVTPFWGYVNQQGSVPLAGKFMMGKWKVSKNYAREDPRLLQWSAAAELVTSYAKTERIFFTDLFLAGKLGPVELMVGQRRNITGLTDSSSNSTGSLSFSLNARPMPRIQLSFPRFYPLHFTGDYLSVKASYSDGLLQPTPLLYGDPRFLPITYLHQKSLYLRLGRPEDRLAIYTGINHQVIWGGENRIWPIEKLNRTDAYWYAISSKTLNNKKVGDHLGTLDIAFEWRGLNWSYLLYRQNLYETGSFDPLSHPEDGIAGLRLRRNNPLQPGSRFFTLQSVVIELIGTKNQVNSRSFSDLAIFDQSNYYNSFLYKNGWSYRGMTIGTPLISPQTVSDTELPSNISQFSNNNKFWAFHTGATMGWADIRITAKATYSLNYGSYLTPFDTKQQQISGALLGERRLSIWRGTTLMAGVFFDYGKLYPNSTGLQISIRKRGLVK